MDGLLWGGGDGPSCERCGSDWELSWIGEVQGWLCSRCQTGRHPLGEDDLLGDAHLVVDQLPTREGSGRRPDEE